MYIRLNWKIMKSLYLLLVLMCSWQNVFGASLNSQANMAQVLGMHVLDKSQGYCMHNFETDEHGGKGSRHSFTIHFLKKARLELLDQESRMVCYEVMQELGERDMEQREVVRVPFEDTLAIKKSSLILMLSLATRKTIDDQLKYNDEVFFSTEVACDYVDLADHKFGTSTNAVFRSMCMNLHEGDECCVQ